MMHGMVQGMVHGMSGNGVIMEYAGTPPVDRSRQIGYHIVWNQHVTK